MRALLVGTPSDALQASTPRACAPPLASGNPMLRMRPSACMPCGSTAHASCRPCHPTLPPCTHAPVRARRDCAGRHSLPPAATALTATCMPLRARCLWRPSRTRWCRMLPSTWCAACLASAEGGTSAEPAPRPRRRSSRRCCLSLVPGQYRPASPPARPLWTAAPALRGLRPRAAAAYAVKCMYLALHEP